MYSTFAFVKITIKSKSGYKYTTCEQMDINKAQRIALEFNIKPN